MLEDRVYQIKEVMDKFGISRDTIYYYEKNGLVSMKREENGYRVFDELNIQKIKKILDLRNLGLSIDEIKQFCSYKNIDKRMEIMLDLQRKTEEELRETKKRLELIQAQQRHISDSSRFTSKFNVDQDVGLCKNCPRCTAEERRAFYVRDGFHIRVLPDGSMLEMKDCEVTLQHLAPSYLCSKCEQKDKNHLRVLRGRIIYEGMQQLQNDIKQAYQLGEDMDYKLQKNLYATLHAPRVDEQEVLSCTLYIPMDDEN